MQLMMDHLMPCVPGGIMVSVLSAPNGPTSRMVSVSRLTPNAEHLMAAMDGVLHAMLVTTSPTVNVLL